MLLLYFIFFGCCTPHKVSAEDLRDYLYGKVQVMRTKQNEMAGKNDGSPTGGANKHPIRSQKCGRNGAELDNSNYANKDAKWIKIVGNFWNSKAPDASTEIPPIM